MSSIIDNFKLDINNKLNKGKAYYVISSFDKVESEFITANSNYIILNSFSDKLKTVLVSDYFKENESFYREHEIDFCKTGINARFFELFFIKEVNNYEVFCINSTGLSYSSIIQLTEFFYEKFINIERKTLFFIHNVDSSIDPKTLVVKEIDSQTSVTIESILKKYRKTKNKTLKF